MSRFHSFCTAQQTWFNLQDDLNVSIWTNLSSLWNYLWWFVVIMQTIQREIIDSCRLSYWYTWLCIATLMPSQTMKRKNNNNWSTPSEILMKGSLCQKNKYRMLDDSYNDLKKKKTTEQIVSENIKKIIIYTEVPFVCPLFAASHWKAATEKAKETPRDEVSAEPFVTSLPGCTEYYKANNYWNVEKTNMFLQIS